MNIRNRATRPFPAARLPTACLSTARLSTTRLSQRGFSLVEVAVSLVALGLVTVLLVHFLGVATRERQEVRSTDLLQRADDALLAYVMINSRLPCPAIDGGGEEDCSAGQVGRLPYKTLGLPDAGARRIRYGVLRRPDVDLRLDADLGRSQPFDRYYPLKVFGDAATTFPLGVSNGLDFCWALRNAQLKTADAKYLHVTSADTSSGIAHVAYAMALPRSGEGFGGEQVDDAPSFDAPRRPASADVHDHVLAVDVDQLWTRMHCGDNLATSEFAHFNAAATITLMHKSFKDYKDQLEVSKKMADANVLSGAAAVAGGVAAVADAAGGVADTVAEGLASTGVVTYRVALAATAVAAAVAVTITAGVMTGYAATAADSAEQAYEDVDGHIQAAETLKDDAFGRAEVADATDLY